MLALALYTMPMSDLYVTVGRMALGTWHGLNAVYGAEDVEIDRENWGHRRFG